MRAIRLVLDILGAIVFLGMFLPVTLVYVIVAGTVAVWIFLLDVHSGKSINRR